MKTSEYCHSALDAEQHLHIIRKLRVKPAMTLKCHFSPFRRQNAVTAIRKDVKITACFLCLFFFSLSLAGQDINLEYCIDRATNHSLQASRVENDFLTGQSDFFNYKAGRLPSVSLRFNPLQYNSQFTKRYDYNENIDVYRQQQLISSSAGVSISQGVELTGGRFTLESDLNYMRNFGENLYTQYSSVPVRFGYSQSLFGYNRLKWEKIIETLKYEKVKKQYLYAREAAAEKAISIFFDLATAQAEYVMATDNIASADTLLAHGKEKNRFGIISQADLLTLELDFISAQNALEDAITKLDHATTAFLSFFDLDNDDNIRIELPEYLPELTIPVEEAFFQMKENNPDILYYRQRELESAQTVEQMKKTGGVDAYISASVGFNQAGNRFVDSYNHPLRQDMVNVSVSVPIVDWGTRKRRLTSAKNNRNVTIKTIEQDAYNLEQELTANISEFNRQRELTKKSQTAYRMANEIYDINKQRFIVGKTDANALTLSRNRKDNTQRTYLSTLNRYWILYYTIRKITLYDFEKREKLSMQDSVHFLH